MRLPVYDNFEAPQTSLPEGLIITVAEEERVRLSDHPQGEAFYQASLMLGRACSVLASTRDEESAQSHMGQAETLLEQSKGGAHGKFSRLSMTTLGKIVASKDQEEEVQLQRMHFYQRTIYTLERAYRSVEASPSPNPHDPRSGFINELLFITLINRYNHPWLLATPALPHHERSSSNAERNHDILVVETSPYFNGASAYKLQAKSACIGLCDNGQNVGTRGRHRYAPDIILVSGCCDLRDKTAQTGRINGSLVSSLGKEMRDQATDAEIKHLDVITDNLLFNITSDDRRRGSYGTELPPIPRPLPDILRDH